MSTPTATASIAKVLDDMVRDLTALESAGKGIPAVERNAIRLRGTLSALQIQFGDLHALQSGA